MITYKITRVDPISRVMQVRYSKPNYQDYFVQLGLEEPIIEEKLHAQAKEFVAEAAHHWQLQDSAQEFQLASDTGIVKERTYEPPPDYDTLTQEIVEVITETDDQEIVSYEIRDLPVDTKIMNIRMERDAMLVQTDAFALTDRVMSDEMIAFRQALRDIPDQAGFPDNVVWPIMPID